MTNIGRLDLDSQAKLEALCDITKQSEEEMIQYIKTEPWCNYYESVEDYNDLMSEILDDEAFEDILDTDSFFIELERLNIERNCEEIIKHLNKYGWRISSSGFAIQFDDDFIEKYNL